MKDRKVVHLAWAAIRVAIPAFADPLSFPRSHFRVAIARNRGLLPGNGDSRLRAAVS